MVCAAALALTAAVSNCSFPAYDIPATNSGSGGGAGMAVAGAGGGGGGSVGGNQNDGGADDAGAAGASGGTGTAGTGSGGEAGAAGGSGGEPCPFPAPVVYPAHCFNRTLGDGETGTDCGGSVCAPCSSNQACAVASDCLSQQCATNKTCVPSISLSYTPIELGALTRTPKFRLNLSYLDTASTPLRELTIRYYYNHNNATEPIIGLDSQATVDLGGMNMQVDISSTVRTSVHRFPLGPKQANGIITDSYLEIAFNDSTTITTGTKFVITQDLVAGSSDQKFDQNSHYSFLNTSAAVVNEAITVYRAGQRLWGVEPAMAFFPECAFAFGVNLNGPALTISGESLVAESDAQFTFNGGAAYANTTLKVPTTDAPTTNLLNTARTLNTGDSAVWAVPNGKYWAYTWLTSTVSSDSGTLTIGATLADRFSGTLSTTSNPLGARWALLGPYAVEVASGSLALTVVDGSVHVAGLKLYEAER